MERGPRKSGNAQRRAILHGHRKRTGVGLMDLLSRLDDAPLEIDVNKLELFYRAETFEIDPQHFEYVARLWSVLPERDRNSRKRPKHEMVVMTPKIRDELRRHWLRVGLSIGAFL